MSDTGWMDHAACIGTDPELWFPDVSDAEGIAAAAAVCAGCPVADPCLDYALRQQLNHGIFAGTTPVERKVLRAERGIKTRGRAGPLAPHGTAAAYRRHQRAGEVPCGPCSRAERLRHAPYDAARTAVAHAAMPAAAG